MPVLNWIALELDTLISPFQVRQKWLAKTVSPAGLGMMKAVKTFVDPQNIFASGNLFPAVPKAKL